MQSKSSSYAISYIVVAFVLVGLYLQGSICEAIQNCCLSLHNNLGQAGGFAGCIGNSAYILGGYPDLVIFGILLILALIACVLGAQPAVLMGGGTVAAVILLSVHQEPLVRYLTLAGALFSIGMYGMVVSRNAVRVLMSIELMLNAVNINMVAFAKYVDPGAIKGQIFAIFILVVAAAEAAVGLAIVLAVYRNRSTVDMEKFNLLKW